MTENSPNQTPVPTVSTMAEDVSFGAKAPQDKIKQDVTFSRLGSIELNSNTMVEGHMPGQQQASSPEVTDLKESMDVKTVNGLPTIPNTRNAEQFYCENCKEAELSEITYKRGTGSWFCCTCCFFCLPIGACLPLCCPDCQDAVHSCPKCKKEVGRNKFCFDSF